jgi:amidase
VAFKSAIQRAKELDDHVKSNGTLSGPLHGIPVTLKDQFNMKGHDTTMGYVGRAFYPAEEDAVLVRILHDLGAIVLAKSNLPQSIMVLFRTQDVYRGARNVLTEVIVV